jgi:hypothetical protein
MVAAAAGSESRLTRGLDGAIRRAVVFLRTRRGDDGLWRDYETLAGLSDEWVTAYVGTALGGVTDPVAVACASEAWGRLVSRRWWSAGRGYNRRVPADADSTAWFLHLAERVGRSKTLTARRAGRFLDDHLLSCGGIATYSIAGPIRRFIGVARDAPFEGWCRDHVCVTGAAATLEHVNGSPMVRAYLRKQQKDDGHWNGYWWADPEFATSLAAEALNRNGTLTDRTAVQAAIAWAEAKVRMDNELSAFSVAAVARLFALAAHEHRCGRHAVALGDELVSRQRRDGSWEPSARLRIPPPNVTEPELWNSWVEGGRGGGAIVIDHAAIFTTATALRALVEVRHLVDS